MTARDELWLPASAQEQAKFKRAGAPKTGNQFGVWAGRDLSYTNLPGGAVMMFDLSKLTLQDYRQMRDHYQCSVSLNLLGFMMHQMDWRIEGGTSAMAAYVDTQLREHWTELVRGMCQAHWAGFSPGVIDWSNDTVAGRIGIDRYKDLVPEDCWVNWKVELGTPSTPGGVPPRFFEYDGIIQAAQGMRHGYVTAGGGGWHIPAESTLWYPMLMESGDYYGRKLLKPAFAPWFFSQLMHLFSNRYFERFGEPLPVGRADFEDQVEISEGEFVSGKVAMENILTNLRNRAVVVLPSDRVPVGNGATSEYAYDIEYLESQMRGVDFERYMTRLDEEISLSLFTPLLMLRTADVGSYNLGTTHVQAYLWMLNSVAGDMKSYIDKFVIERLRLFNWGKNSPKMTFEYRNLGKDNAQLLQTLVMETVRTGMAKPDLNQLGEAVGMDFEAITDMTQAPGAYPAILQEETGGKGAPAPVGAKPVQKDNRPSRPARKVPGGVKKQISARVKAQLEKHRRGDATLPFTADIGFRRQVSDWLEPAEVDAAYKRMGQWLTVASADGMTTPEIMTYFDKVADFELAA